MHSTNRHESAQIRNTATSYDWPFLYRNNSLISLTGVSSRLSRRLYFSFSKATRVVVRYPVTTPSYITDGGTSSRVTSSVFKTNCDYMEWLSITPKTGFQNIQPVRLWYKNANVSDYHRRVGSCNFNQSRAEALPVARSHEAGEGRDIEIK